MIEDHITDCCCFSGHRDIDCFDLYIMEKTRKAIEDLISRGVRRYIIGGAIGYDMLCAILLSQFKRRGSDIHITFALPCRDHDRFWNEKQKATMQILLGYSDEVIYLSPTYDSSCMHRRNRYMVDNSRYCICYLNSDKGGTAYTVAYAESKGLEIINIATPES